MNPTELVTLVVASAGFVTSCVVAIETLRQGRNAVRPVLVVLEKYTDNKNKLLGRSLYLVNMGQAVALNVKVKEPTLENCQTAIAVGRRGRLDTGYEDEKASKTSLTIRYTDVNDKKYETRWDGTEHEFVQEWVEVW